MRWGRRYSGLRRAYTENRTHKTPGSVVSAGKAGIEWPAPMARRC
jgi:hypothetical protein